MPVIPGPSATISEITSTTFSVVVTGLSGAGGTTIYLGVRARGSAVPFSDTGFGSPVLGATLTCTALTAETPLDWHIQERAGTTIYDGTHGQVTPSTAIWATILSALGTALAGVGLTNEYQGIAPPPNYEDAIALMLTRPEVVRRSANNLATLEYPVEVELRVNEASDTGELRTQSIATYQRGVIAALDRKGTADFPSIPGLELVTVDVRTKDNARPDHDDFADETRAQLVVRFLVNEARL